jgi:ABC-2 type transport system permease protein
MKPILNKLPISYGSGFPTLLRKEIKRFYKVAFQTVAAPVLTAVLYLMIFGHVLEGKEVYGRLNYTAFLIPGLVMMSVLQNAFANTSSSLIQSKVTGNLVFGEALTVAQRILQVLALLLVHSFWILML